ncbi:MAG TPA: hypothetical protein VKW08_18930 [Xanthobacteraceae bacterium]|jgi:hypothetical protein|nr:hypothetical protein [Xanthobacteraceae bacterium]
MLIRSAVTAVPLLIVVLAAALGTASPAKAQVKVRTETIHPPSTTAPSSMNQFVPPGPQPGAIGSSGGATSSQEGVASLQPVTGAEIPSDPARLPAAVAQERARILAAAATGDLTALTGLMQANGITTIFSHTQRQDPIAYWKDLYPDSDGIEILAILISILDAPPAHINAGTPQEMYVWPYFARLPIATLTPAQKVELFRVVTGFDYRGMLERGRYVFYQVGIQPDGAWRYFLQSDE